MFIVQTWHESTKETELYLEFNGYGKVRRIAKTDYYFCTEKGNDLADVKVIL